jgi:hypothetical protein
VFFPLPLYIIAFGLGWFAWRRHWKLDREEKLFWYILSLCITYVGVLIALIPNQEILTPFGIHVLVWGSIIAVGGGGGGYLVYLIYPTVEPRAECKLYPVFDTAHMEHLPQVVREQVEEMLRQGTAEQKYQTFRVTARKMMICNCKVLAKFNGAEAHLLWEGMGTETHQIAKEQVTLQVGDFGTIMLWGAARKNDKAALYFPTVSRPQAPYPIGSDMPPLKLEVTLIAEKLNDKPHHFTIYREAWETLRTEEIR